MGGRDQEMTFGIGRIDYGAMYKTDANARTIAAASGTVDGPNKAAVFNLAHLPSDAVVAKEYGKSTAINTKVIAANKQYVLNAVDGTDDAAADTTPASLITAGVKQVVGDNDATTITGVLAQGEVLKSAATADSLVNGAKTTTANEVNDTDNAFVAGDEFEIVSMGTSDGNTGTNFSDAAAILAATSVAGGTLAIGTKFTVDAAVTKENLAKLNALTSGMTFRRSTDTLTKDIEAIQGLVNTARVQAGSQYAALESAVNYTTDLTAQYELGYNTVNDVNFSMETAHLAKNQILQQAATAMLAQANQGQQGLLQLIS
jgi:flagellin